MGGMVARGALLALAKSGGGGGGHGGGGRGLHSSTFRLHLSRF